MDYTLEELYKIRNGLWNLRDCEILDTSKDFISIIIDFDFYGTFFNIMTKEDCLEVYCRPENYGKTLTKRQN